MEELLNSPLLIVIILVIFILIGFPFVILIKILNKIHHHFDKLELELKRISNKNFRK